MDIEGDIMYKINDHYPIRMKRNQNGDTRTATHIPSIREFDEANSLHRDDVRALVARFSQLLEESARNHDWSKVKEPYRSMFYRDLVDTMNGRIKFEDGEWCQLHYNDLERHHLLRNTPDDVDLFDVIEMVCDCVAAGMVRSGEVRPLEISNEVFQKALDNTVEILKEQIELTDE